MTEEQYLVHWRRRYRGSVLVHIAEYKGSPRQLVERAVKAKQQAERDERRRRGRAFDAVWCIYDVDDHAHLHEALELANAHGIGLAISNPCIELWFILHFESQAAYIERGAAQSRSRALLGCEKALSEDALSMLDEGYGVAMGRAQQLDEKHSGDGSPAGANPSSGVWRLIEAIKS